jgi:hypothetical protein
MRVLPRVDLRRARARAEDPSFAESVLVDAAIDAYVGWREQSSAARRAYGRWSEAEHRDRPAAFAAYVRALDREGRAADVYAAVIDRYQRVRLALHVPAP